MSSAKRKFADSLNEFKFQCIGDAETDDEMCIGKSRPRGRQKHSSKPSLGLGGLLVRNPVSREGTDRKVRASLLLALAPLPVQWQAGGSWEFYDGVLVHLPTVSCLAS